MKLLEREKYLSELNDLLEMSLSGNGKIAAVCGEAGIGKTSLIEAFTNSNNNKIKIYRGTCDDMFTHQPLAPLYDIALNLNKSLINQLDSGTPRPSVFANLLENLKSNEPNIIVIEDVHWADEATLDLIKFLGRRINRCKSLLLLSYRDDEVTSDHPLKLTLGSITSGLRRINLPPLSADAINRLIENYGGNFKDLFKHTGGNPFFVTEILSNNENEIPASVKDLINSRLGKLPEQSLKAVKLISVIPNRAERWLLKELIENFSALDQPIEFGLLKTDGDHISFRHELGRISVEELLSESERINLNSLVLEVLLRQKNKSHFFARIIHHAEKAHNSEAIVKFAPLAAQQASKLGAHLEAAKNYQVILKYSDILSVNEHLDMLEGRAYECNITGQIEEGVKACETVKKILAVNPDSLREGRNFRMLSRLMWYAGEDSKGEQYLKKSIDIFEKLPPSKELAMAYSNLSQIYMCREETKLSLKWGAKAIELARKIKDKDVEIHSLNNIGTAKMFAGDDSGESDLQKSLELSVEYDMHDHISRAYDNLGTAFIYRRKLPEALNYFSIGIEYCQEKDLDSHGLCMTAEMSKTKLFLGKWDEAVDTANNNLVRDNVPLIDKVVPFSVIGVIRARRNDPGALEFLDKAEKLAVNSGEAGKIVTAVSSKAEALWLQNKISDFVPVLDSVYSKIKMTKNPWAIGEIAFWLWKAGSLKAVPGEAAEPYFFQIQGDWKKAAKIWEKLQCPYEHALALADGDESAAKKALEIFNSLGANAASQLIKRKMREAGIKKIPVGPRKATKDNPEGLTKRQTEVLILLSKGLSNADIAENLFISPKTVDHHVSAVFSKLNIHSRTEAAAFVHSNNISVK